MIKANSNSDKSYRANYVATVIKTVWYWSQKRPTAYWKRLQSRKKYTHTMVN